MRRLLLLLTLLAMCVSVLDCSRVRSRTRGSNDGDDDDDSAANDDDASDDDDSATGDDDDDDGSDDDDSVANDDDATGDDDDSTPDYLCGWEVFAGADSLGEPGISGSAAPGVAFPRFSGFDQCGDSVDLYHLAGRPTLIAVQAMWSVPDNTLSDWVGGGDGSAMGLNSYEGVRQSILVGDLGWISLLWQDTAGGLTSASHAAAWDAQHPNGMPVLADPFIDDLANWADIGFMPFLILVDDEMTVIEVSDGAWTQPLDAAAALF